MLAPPSKSYRPPQGCAPHSLRNTGVSCPVRERKRNTTRCESSSTYRCANKSVTDDNRDLDVKYGIPYDNFWFLGCVADHSQMSISSLSWTFPDTFSRITGSKFVARLISENNSTPVR
ncbi:hypothetical protein TNCV_4323901 [Trichonephila clavipes]|nr:hypothetical protein TNCV_4323901 [Trichonephila clavipes]